MKNFIDFNIFSFQLGDILGGDYERKMAVVGVLKRYAEERDVTILCAALDSLLDTPTSRNVVKHIR